MVDWATILLATILAAFTPGADKATRFNFCPVALQLVFLVLTNLGTLLLSTRLLLDFFDHQHPLLPTASLLLSSVLANFLLTSIPSAFSRLSTQFRPQRQTHTYKMGESRQELIQWLNQLLSLNITKVEQCGTGAALCQVFDSIFMDIPMSRVKFNVNSEYAYIQNFKVLQNCFHKHQVDKPIPVEALVKCKMQDNLEFLQWTKKFWDLNFPDQEYDAVSRRKGAPVPSGGGPAPRAASGTGASAARRGGTTPLGGARVPKAAGPGTAALQQENATLKETVVGLERERDFYFSKLRDIELLVQQAVEEDPELEKQEDGLVKQIQTILYSTEEGFEIPAEGEAVDDQETF
ncbi:EB1-like domain-containing protein [Colletotrichum lupini]|uniref:EB1-like domain-containing protein n=1 Tax=Colletotrichum lupini TaxID=145971 RepID=A0A9Q8WD36_9PEZI|nr:EB1-like domain-containing protein [Colletotrichum lupini]UQC78741.1 EB1-like domain-containing protein [Colletotrichum lupini]